MKEYKKPLVDVFELRVTESIAAPSASAKAKWEKYGGTGVWVTEGDLVLGGASANTTP